MQRSAFEGFVEEVQRAASQLVVRIVEGGFDPSPPSPPVWIVTIEEPEDGEAAAAALALIRSAGEGVYAWIESETMFRVQADHGDEVSIKGKKVLAVEAGFDPRDYERLAKLNHEWGKSQDLAFSEQSKRLQRIRDLLHDQHQRVTRKAESHPIGSTARTLYEQQLAFFARLLAETEA